MGDVGIRIGDSLENLSVVKADDRGVLIADLKFRSNERCPCSIHPQESACPGGLGTFLEVDASGLFNGFNATHVK